MSLLKTYATNKGSDKSALLYSLTLTCIFVKYFSTVCGSTVNSVECQTDRKVAGSNFTRGEVCP